MTDQETQLDYETRLRGFASLIHGNSPPGLAAKLAIYSELLRQHEMHGDGLWLIEPLLFPLIKSVEVDLHLAMARLLESPKRSERGFFKFLAFCEGNRLKIAWRHGPVPLTTLQEQISSLEAHRSTIDAIMGRRDKYFAHLDKEYFEDASAVYVDFQVEEEDVIALANAMIHIVADHQASLHGTVNINIAEFYAISVDNMVRNLRTGRKINFPDQGDAPFGRLGE